MTPVKNWFGHSDLSESLGAVLTLLQLPLMASNSPPTANLFSVPCWAADQQCLSHSFKSQQSSHPLCPLITFLLSAIKDLLGLLNSVACQCFEAPPRPPVFLVCVSIHFGTGIKSALPRSDSRFSCALLKLQPAGLQHSWQGAEPWKDFAGTACFPTSFALEGTRSKAILKPTLLARQHREGQS